MKPIATVHWTDPEGNEWHTPLMTDNDMTEFLKQLQKDNVLYYNCLCGGNVQFNTPKRLSEIV